MSRCCKKPTVGKLAESVVRTDVAANDSSTLESSTGAPPLKKTSVDRTVEKEENEHEPLLAAEDLLLLEDRILKNFDLHASSTMRWKEFWFHLNYSKKHCAWQAKSVRRVLPLLFGGAKITTNGQGKVVHRANYVRGLALKNTDTRMDRITRRMKAAHMKLVDLERNGWTDAKQMVQIYDSFFKDEELDNKKKLVAVDVDEKNQAIRAETQQDSEHNPAPVKPVSEKAETKKKNRVEEDDPDPEETVRTTQKGSSRGKRDQECTRSSRITGTNKKTLPEETDQVGTATNSSTINSTERVEKVFTGATTTTTISPGATIRKTITRAARTTSTSKTKKAFTGPSRRKLAEGSESGRISKEEQDQESEHTPTESKLKKKHGGTENKLQKKSNPKSADSSSKREPEECWETEDDQDSLQAFETQQESKKSKKKKQGQDSERSKPTDENKEKTDEDVYSRAMFMRLNSPHKHAFVSAFVFLHPTNPLADYGCLLPHDYTEAFQQSFSIYCDEDRLHLLSCWGTLVYDEVLNVKPDSPYLFQSYDDMLQKLSSDIFFKKFPVHDLNPTLLYFGRMSECARTRFDPHALPAGPRLHMRERFLPPYLQEAVKLCTTS